MNNESYNTHPLITIFRVLLSLPLAVLWMGIFVLLHVGWGSKTADAFIVAWNSMMYNDGDNEPPTAPSCGCG